MTTYNVKFYEMFEHRGIYFKIYENGWLMLDTEEIDYEIREILDSDAASELSTDEISVTITDADMETAWQTLYHVLPILEEEFLIGDARFVMMANDSWGETSYYDNNDEIFSALKQLASDWNKPYEILLALFKKDCQIISAYDLMNDENLRNEILADIERGCHVSNKIVEIVNSVIDEINSLDDTLNSLMTPSEIQSKYALSDNTVRQYIHNHQDLLIASKKIRKADHRTWLVNAKWAERMWGGNS